MRLYAAAGVLALGVVAPAFGGAAFAQGDLASWLGGEQPQVVVQHAAARVVVIAEPRRDVSVTVQHGANPLPQLLVRREGGRIVVDGGLARPFGGERIDCRGGLVRGTFGVSDQRAAVVGGYGRIAYRDLPVVTAHVPLDARLAGEGAIYGEASPTRSLSLASAGCGDWTLGPVQGRLDAKLSGSGDLHGQDVGSLRATVSGSSDIYIGQVADGAEVVLAGSGDLHAAALRGPLQARVAGSGDLTAGRMDGPVHADVAGSGDVKLGGGRAPQVVARVAGSGDFTFNGQAGQVDAVATGSGDIHIAHASGPVSRVSTGSAEVVVGR